MYFLYPETKGVPLEEMDAVFGEGLFLPAFRRFCTKLFSGEAKGYATLPHSTSGLPAPSSNSSLYPARANNSGMKSQGWLSRLFNRNTSRKELRGRRSLQEEEVALTSRRPSEDDDERGDGFVVGDEEEDFEMLDSGSGRK